MYSNREIEKDNKKVKQKLEQIEEELLIIGGDFKAKIGEEGNLYSGEAGNISEQRSGDSHNRSQLTELELYLGNRVEFDY